MKKKQSSLPGHRITEWTLNTSRVTFLCGVLDRMQGQLLCHQSSQLNPNDDSGRISGSIIPFCDQESEVSTIARCFQRLMIPNDIFGAFSGSVISLSEKRNLESVSGHTQFSCSIQYTVHVYMCRCAYIMQNRLFLKVFLLFLRYLDTFK